MYKIIDGKVVKVEQFETITEVTSETISNEIKALEVSKENISAQIELLKSELVEVQELESSLIKKK
jgi:chaperonin cofactor prefoldin